MGYKANQYIKSYKKQLNTLKTRKLVINNQFFSQEVKRGEEWGGGGRGDFQCTREMFHIGDLLNVHGEFVSLVKPSIG